MDLNTKTYFCRCHLCELQDDITVLGRGYRCTRSPPAGNKLRCCRGGKPTLCGQDGWFYRRHTMPLQAPDQSEYHPTKKAIFMSLTRTVGQVPDQSGYHAHNGRWVKFSVWIPDHLQPATQAKLQKEMQKELSSSDKRGYPYVFEIRDPKAPATREMLMKVGREGTLDDRIKYWKRHYRSCVLRFPLDVLNRDETMMVPFCKRLERLVHIELADLVQHSAYLDPQYPKAGKAPAPCAKKPKRSCIVRDCAVIHIEVFPFMREKRKRDVDKIIGDIILRWSEFCKTCY